MNTASKLKKKAESAKLFGYILWLSARTFIRDGNLQRAAALAYYGLFALFPLMALLFSLLTFVLSSSEDAFETLYMISYSFAPWVGELLKKETLLTFSQTSLIGVLGGLTLAWTSMPLVGALRRTFYDIFRVTERPSFFRTKLRDSLVIIISLGALLALSIAGLVLRKTHLVEGLGTAYGLLGFLFSVGIIYVVYKVFSPRNVRPKYITEGALMAVAIWWVIGPIFKKFIAYNPNYGIAFGSFKALFLGVLWVYVSFGVLLFGAEFIANRRKRDVLLLRKLFYESETLKDERLTRRFGRHFKPGEVIFKEGSAGNGMFYIQSGSVQLLKNNQELTTLGAKQYFGEIALLIETPRTAEARAGQEGALLIHITPENFETLLREEPAIAMMFLRELAQRLKKTNEAFTA